MKITLVSSLLLTIASSSLLVSCGVSQSDSQISTRNNGIHDINDIMMTNDDSEKSDGDYFDLDIKQFMNSRKIKSQKAFCTATLQNNSGKSWTNEDRFIDEVYDIGGNIISVHGVFDGHGGSKVSNYLSEEFGPLLQEHLNSLELPYLGSTIPGIWLEKIRLLIETVFKRADQHICKEMHQINTGSTASLVIRVADTAFIVNLGDSKTILSDNGKILDVTVDHVPNTLAEQDHILSKGGSVIKKSDKNVPRLNGRLAMSRSFGDCQHKVGSLDHYLAQSKTSEYYDWNGMLRAVPDIRIHKLQPGKSYEFFSATDGFFDVFKVDNKMSAYIREQIVQMDLGLCKNMVNWAQKKYSRDDITVVISSVRF